MVLEVEPAGPPHPTQREGDAGRREAEEVSEYAEREDAAPPGKGSGSLADKLRGALGSRNK